MSFARAAVDSQSRAADFGYRSDIDGLRALAVGSVVLYHADQALVPGGYTGVDVFFVISGYLITSILANDLGRDRFSVLGFYDRRIRRIFPALFVMLAATTVCAVAWMSPGDLLAYARTLVAATLFSSNVLFWRESGYFELASEVKPLLHTWSLAVEEQYYIFFPLMLWAAWRWRAERVVIWAGIVGSLALCIWGVRGHATPTFFLLPTRAWELFFGSVLALGAVPAWNSKPVREAMGLAGLGLLAAGFFGLTRTTPFPSEAALLPCGGAALVIWSGLGGRRTLAGRLLSLRPIVFVGLISYSLYLWHWPVLVFARYLALGPLSGGPIAAAIALSIGLATLSWRFVERPFRHRPDRSAEAPIARLLGSRRRVVAIGLAVMAIAVAGGVAVMRGVGSDARILRLYGPDVAAFSRVAKPATSPEGCLGSVAAALEPRCRLGDAEKPATIAFWGDSFTDALLPGHAEIIGDGAAFRFVYHACPSILGTELMVAAFAGSCRRFTDEVAATLAAHPETTTVVIANNYLWYLDLQDFEFHGILRPTGFAGGDEATRRAANLERIAATAERLAAMGKRVVMLGAFDGRPELGAVQTLRALVRHPDARARLTVPVAAYDAKVAPINDRLRAILTPGVVFVDPRPVFCPRAATAGVCDYDQDGPLLVDDGHVTAAAARRIAALIRRTLDASPAP